jgi:hypothetical protein
LKGHFVGWGKATPHPNKKILGIDQHWWQSEECWGARAYPNLQNLKNNGIRKGMFLWLIKPQSWRFKTT